MILVYETFLFYFHSLWLVQQNYLYQWRLKGEQQISRFFQAQNFFLIKFKKDFRNLNYMTMKIHLYLKTMSILNK